MDEIIIEEKKYVSSKQAAKITGYAKDYIGQLCREGRVPSRLVGRGWYVLESAIKDHRFGTQVQKDIAVTTQEKSHDSGSAGQILPYPMIEFPRYEAISPEVLPSLNLLSKNNQVSIETQVNNNQSPSKNIPQNLQDSWKEWFDKASESLSTVDIAVRGEIAPASTEEYEQKETGDPVKDGTDDGASGIPLHIIQDVNQSTEKELPPMSREPERERMPVNLPSRKGSSAAGRVAQALGVFLAVASALVAVVGSGYLDNYLVSFPQVTMVSGISVYNK